MRIAVFGVLALGLFTAACGSDETQRSATGGLTGVGVGAAVGGPIGAVVGGVAGAAGGAVLPEGADTAAENALHKERGGAQSARNDARQAQAELAREGLYSGKIDGIVGPKTRQALAAFQQRQGLRQTASLDRETRQRLAAASPAAAHGNGNAATEASGTSTPPAPSSPLPAANGNGTAAPPSSTPSGANTGH
ncbi:MAG: peptidoglycan-binding domain-containing protein [Stellaceae bacterium]